MPYVHVRTNKEISEDNKNNIKTRIGEDIKLLGKSEDWLMVDIDSNNDMYFRGNKDDIAYVEVKLYGRSDSSHYNLFTEAISNNISENTGVMASNIYVSYFETSNWGWNGKNF